MPHLNIMTKVLTWLNCKRLHSSVNRKWHWSLKQQDSLNYCRTITVADLKDKNALAQSMFRA